MKGHNDEDENFGIYLKKLRECIKACRQKGNIDDQAILGIYFLKFRECIEAWLQKGDNDNQETFGVYFKKLEGVHRSLEVKLEQGYNDDGGKKNFNQIFKKRRDVSWWGHMVGKEKM